MTRMLALSAAAATTLVTLLAVPANAASTNAADGQQYSHHVRDCRSAMGFTGTHNPGVMHRGYSGWDPDHTC